MQSSQLFSLPLAKYSRAVDVPKDVVNFTWTHFTQGLILVLDNFRGNDNGFNIPSLMLKVVSETQVLEAISVQGLIKEAEDIILAMQRLRVEVRNEQLPISALVRSPLFALRYNLPDGKVRRVQLKFMSDHDFQTVYDHLQKLGLRMSRSDQRPSTTQASSSASLPESSGPSCPSSKLAEFSNRPSTAVSVHPNSSARTTPRVSSPLARHSMTPTSIAEETRGRIDLSSAANVASFAQFVKRSSIADPLIPPEVFQRPISSSSSLDRPFSNSAGEREPLSSPSIVDDDITSLSSRPSSAIEPPSHKLSDTLLPPRRELPFARASAPKSSGSDTARPSSRASNSTMGPPLRPASAHTNRPPLSVSQTLDRGPSAPSLPIHPQPSWMVEAAKPMTAPTGSSSLRPSSEVTGSSFLPQSAPNEDVVRQITSINPGPGPSPFNLPISSTQQDATPLQRLSTADQNRLNSASSAQSASSVQSDVSYQDRIISELGRANQTDTNDVFRQYAARSDHERMALLDDFILQHVDDNSFLNLVEDVSVCWTRILHGLG